MMENLVWKAYYHSMSGHEIRPFNIFEHADTGILRMAIANTNTRGPSLEKMRTFLPIMVPELLP